MTTPGRFLTSPGGLQCFVPEPLPPRLELPPKTVALIEEATYRLGKVEMCRHLLKSPDVLTYGSIVNEAIASSTIEGTIASADELLRYQVGVRQLREQVREVANYQEALKLGVEMLKDRPISINLIRSIHGRLLEGVRGAHTAGEFKNQQNLVGWDADKEAPIFVPPPPDRTMDLMSDLEKYINSDPAEPKLVQVALAHYQFETIHPFADGNGRVGRLLIVLHLLQLGLLTEPLVYPSVYFERNRDAYFNGLQSVRERGAWIEWIDYFTAGIVEQCDETLRVANLILELQDRLREQVGSVQSHASVQRVLEAFFVTPVLGTRAVASRAGVARNTARSALLRLREMGILDEFTGARNERIYYCKPILEILLSRTGNQPQ
ncbi:MAG: cell division protein Fic [Fimbriimonadales bacterium]|nr:MAG: cell division protein Fic [Fimbriimonadales bacterium]